MLVILWICFGEFIFDVEIFVIMEILDFVVIYYMLDGVALDVGVAFGARL